MDAKRGAVLAASMATVVSLLVGCAAYEKTPATAAQWAGTAGSDLNCSDHATVRPGSTTEYYDINGDGAPESFVDLICSGAGAGTRPDQVEVFDGTSRQSRIARLTSIATRADKRMYLAHGCIYFSGRKVIIIGRTFNRANLPSGPTVLAVEISTWIGAKLVVGQPTPLPSTVGLPPGCNRA